MERQLAHHGVKDQKWGVRRFQNYDGTLTQVGKARLVSKTNKKHNFEDKNDVSINRRQDAKDAVLGAWGVTTINAALGAGMMIPAGPIGALVGAGVLATPTALLAGGMTADFIVKDAKAKKADKKEAEFAEERAQNPIDKKTGFHTKTKEMSPEDDMERVNPAFKNWDDNTKNNCVLCTAAFELRRRGYDVQAKKATSGYNGNEIIKDWFNDCKVKDSEGQLTDIQLTEMARKGIPPYITPEKKKVMVSNTISEIQNQKDGARGQITITWDGTLSGHSIAYANEGGKVVIYDTQANKKYEGDAAEKYLKQASQIAVTRFDNCPINVKYIKEVAG